MVKKKDVIETSDGVDMHGFLKTLNKDGRSAYACSQRLDPAEIKAYIPTGSTLLDYAISNRRNGGIPYGRVTEISGLESSGKSLLSLHIIANAQKRGGVGLILDTEDRLLDKDFLIRLGVDPNRLAIDNPGSIEGCFEKIERTIKFFRSTESSKSIPLVIVWDSIAATPPLAELEGSFDPQSQMGLGAKAVARGVRKLTHTIGTQGVALIIINQLRHNMKAMPFMDPWVTPYGKSVDYLSSTRMRVTKCAKLKDENNDLVGETTKFLVTKSSLGPPLREVFVPMIHGYGIDDQQSLYDYLHAQGNIKKVAGTSKITIEEKPYEFPNDKWKTWLAQDNHQGLILDLIEKLMVKRFETHDPKNDMQLSEDLSPES